MGGTEKNSGIKRIPVYKSPLSYKLSLLSFAEFSGITREMYVFRYNRVRYKYNESLLYSYSISSSILIDYPMTFKVNEASHDVDAAASDQVSQTYRFCLAKLPLKRSYVTKSLYS
jgi:hypothetical protein